jgi:hypothetical protein
MKGGWRKLHNELQMLLSSQNIIRTVIFWSMRHAGHTARMHTKFSNISLQPVGQSLCCPSYSGSHRFKICAEREHKTCS